MIEIEIIMRPGVVWCLFQVPKPCSVYLAEVDRGKVLERSQECLSAAVVVKSENPADTGVCISMKMCHQRASLVNRL